MSELSCGVVWCDAGYKFVDSEAFGKNGIRSKCGVRSSLSTAPSHLCCVCTLDKIYYALACVYACVHDNLLSHSPPPIPPPLPPTHTLDLQAVHHLLSVSVALLLCPSTLSCSVFGVTCLCVSCTCPCWSYSILFLCRSCCTWWLFPFLCWPKMQLQELLSFLCDYHFTDLSTLYFASFYTFLS